MSNNLHPSDFMEDSPLMSDKERGILQVIKERCGLIYSDPFDAHEAEEGLSFVIRGGSVRIYAWRSYSERVLRSMSKGNLDTTTGRLRLVAPLDEILWA